MALGNSLMSDRFDACRCGKQTLRRLMENSATLCLDCDRFEYYKSKSKDKWPEDLDEVRAPGRSNSPAGL